MNRIDTSGLSCPQPVLLVLQCITNESPTALEVIVDNEASFENVTRAAQNNGYSVSQGQVDANMGSDCKLLNLIKQ